MLQSTKLAGSPAKASKVQFSQEPQGPGPRGIRSVSLFAPDTRTASGASTSNLLQGPSSSAQGPEDLSEMHARAYMESQESRRGTSFVDASGSQYNFKGSPGGK